MSKDIGRVYLQRPPHMLFRGGSELAFGDALVQPVCPSDVGKDIARARPLWLGPGQSCVQDRHDLRQLSSCNIRCLNSSRVNRVKVFEPAHG